MTLVTYIIKTQEGEYYCNKTDHLVARLNFHRHEECPYWFAYKNRRDFEEVMFFTGDHVKKVKAFGISRLYKLVKNHQQLPLLG